MAKDRGGGKARSNPPKSGKAGKGPGNSPTKSSGTNPGYGRKGPAKNPPMGPGPGNKGGKPPRI
jgi:hypothetical protein